MHRRAKSAVFWLGIVLAAAVSVEAQNGPPGQQFDLVITHGQIVDGTGSPWYSGDVGIRDGPIAAIGNLARRRA